MSTSFPVEDQRPWDARLVEWMSRDSATQPPKEQQARASAVLTLVHVIAMTSAISIARGYLWLMPAMAFVTLCLRLFRRARGRHARAGRQPAEATQNPFGR
jgi:hypothetical protein